MAAHCSREAEQAQRRRPVRKRVHRAIGAGRCEFRSCNETTVCRSTSGINRASACERARHWPGLRRTSPHVSTEEPCARKPEKKFRATRDENARPVARSPAQPWAVPRRRCEQVPAVAEGKRRSCADVRGEPSGCLASPGRDSRSWAVPGGWRRPLRCPTARAARSRTMRASRLGRRQS
jgi:hypothetical protein